MGGEGEPCHPTQQDPNARSPTSASVGRFESRIEQIEIDGQTAKALKEICSRKPFKKRRVEEYTYWIEGVEQTEQTVDNPPNRTKRTNPRLALLIRRGKSRLKTTIPCPVDLFFRIRPISFEFLDGATRKAIEEYESTLNYLPFE